MQKVAIAIVGCLACASSSARLPRRSYVARTEEPKVAAALTDEALTVLARLLLPGAEAAFRPHPVLSRPAFVTSAVGNRRFVDGRDTASPSMFFDFGGGDKGGQKGGKKPNTGAKAGRRADKAGADGARARLGPGQVEVRFPQKNKVTVAMRGDLIYNVAKKANVPIYFDCKNGVCGTCQIRLNGRVSMKVCQGARIPEGGAKIIDVMLDNPTDKSRR